ncbi:MAG: S8 family serine peptidase, partial [Elusimicrobiota bacterium]|nr:S8 family serine peptidase [Elusimicrobiota bacterium]
MKQLYKSILLFLPLCFLFGTAHAVKIEKLSFITPQGLAKSREVVSGQAFVKFSKKVSTATKKQLLKGAGAEKIKDMDFIGWTLVKIPKGMKVGEGIRALKKIKGAEAVEPNNVYRVSRVPNDPYVSAQYALDQINAYGAWEYETGFSSRVTVAIMDMGIDGTNTELSGKLNGIVHQFFDPNNAGTMSSNNPSSAVCSHGTRVAGISAATSDNSSGIAGISWGAKLLSLKVFSDVDCAPNCDALACTTDDATIVKAIEYVTGIHNSTTTGKIVLNMSLGGPPPCIGVLQAAINTADAAGVFIVAAAGNDGTNNINSPACCDNVIPVGATDSSNNLAYFSTTGSDMTNRGLVAPGVSVYTTDLSNSFAYADGTSFSSPGAAGLAALIWSAKPILSPLQVGDLMRNTADDLGAPGPDSSYGWGRINAFKALRYNAEGSLAGFKGEEKAIAYPNPFYVSKDKRITFDFPSSVSREGLQIKIYNMEGELVRKIDGMTWDGKNHTGSFAASGI